MRLERLITALQDVADWLGYTNSGSYMSALGQKGSSVLATARY